jgi:DNA polymerase kappa
MEETEEPKVSKISGFFIKEKHKAEQLQTRAFSIQQKITRELQNPEKYLQEGEESIQRLIKSLESSRDNSETWIYIDMDMFFASIEIRDNPSLADKPIGVLNGTIISTANYVARRYGIKSSMPEFKAIKLCPDLILIPQNLEKYRRESNIIKSIFSEYDYNFEQLGLDEAGLHVTHVLKKKCSDTDAGRQALAAEIRQKIFSKTQLTASAGISCNKMLAKMCSKINKPNGQFYLKPENVKEYMKNVSLCDVPGISKQESKLLKLLGLYKCSDILKKKLELYFGLSKQFLTTVLKSALGIGPTDHQNINSREKKTISATKSFEPTEDPDTLESKISELSNQIDFEMKKNKVRSKAIEIILKTFTYETRTRRERTKAYFYNGKEVNELAVTLIRILYPLDPIRSITIKISKFKPSTGKPNAKKSSKSRGRKYSTSEFENMFLNNSILPEKTFLFEHTSNIKVFRHQCKHCGNWLTGTKSSLSFHEYQCTGYLKKGNIQIE